MKIRMALMPVLLLLLISSNNRTGRVGHFQEGEVDSFYLISIIENYWSDGRKLYIKLSETKDICYFANDDKPGWEEKISVAINSCRPLMFRINNFVIEDIKEPDDTHTHSYLETYDTIKYYELDSLESNAPEPKYFSGQMSKDFFSFLKQHHFMGENINLEFGCEARAGIVARFLNENAGHVNYKLFLSGKIRFQSGNTRFCWINHVVNLIAFKNKGCSNIYVFDPFMLREIIPVKDYLASLRKSGSEDLKFRITGSDVFVCNMNCRRGITDRNYYYAGIIFNKLYQ